MSSFTTSNRSILTTTVPSGSSLLRRNSAWTSCCQRSTDGLIIVQDLTIVKAGAIDARARPAPLESSKPIVTVPAKLVLIYLSESDRCREECLGEPIEKKLRIRDFSGAPGDRVL